MKLPQINILWLVVAVLLTLQVKSLFDKANKPERMIRNEERIKYLEEKRLADSVALIETRNRYDSLILLSAERSIELAQKYKSTKIIYEKIPVIINDFDREQLRRAITDY